MRVIYLILSAVVALVLEFYAWDTLIFHVEGASFLKILYLHILSSLIAAYGCVYVRIPCDNRERDLFFLLLIMVLLMPGFGLLGVYIAILHALLHPKKQRGMLWKDVPVPSLPYKPVIVGAHPTYGEGGLSSVIQSASDMSRRLNAVVAARQINDKMAVPLLQEALKDPEDDVRLFAYAVLDSKTTAVTDRITDLLLKTESEVGLAKARLCYALAQNYWELSFLGLVTGNTLSFALNEAEKFAHQAASLGWSGSDIEFLIGRILLYQKKYPEAKKYFDLSLENGALESAILPFLSEIAYERQDFLALRTLLERLNTSCDGNTPIPAVVTSWSIAS
ncbi:MAG: hypothetical protein COB41_06510 [Proteobacteria bacterium]|nr:MAG: hypothetical protein COB41_06510 [Pseudomonadota bacterium]